MESFPFARRGRLASLSHGAGLPSRTLSTRSDGKANPPYARMTRKGLDWSLARYCGQHIVA